MIIWAKSSKRPGAVLFGLNGKKAHSNTCNGSGQSEFHCAIMAKGTNLPINTKT